MFEFTGVRQLLCCFGQIVVPDLQNKARSVFTEVFFTLANLGEVSYGPKLFSFELYFSDESPRRTLAAPPTENYRCILSQKNAYIITPICKQWKIVHSSNELIFFPTGKLDG